MKKNKMLRMASTLMVLTLLTTSIIGGTFAKYTTTGSATDTARVAKFGVVVTVSGDLFGSTYKAKADGNTITSYSVNGGTVSAADGATTKVVAPGTKEEKGLTLSVTGTPEVSTKVTLGNVDTYADSDIYLAIGEYGVMVQYTGELTTQNISNYYTKDADGTYTQATTVPTDPNAKVYELHDAVEVKDTAYYPLKWKVDNGGAITENIANVNAVKEALKTTFPDNKTFAPNTNNALSAKITWEWPFDIADNNGANDGKDTILGDMIAAQLTETDPIAVVAKSGGKYVTVTYREEDAAIDSANKVINAYAGEGDSAVKVACLTVAFNAALTVTQVD